MPEQITYYHDLRKMSPFSLRVELALVEARASYTPCGIDLQNKPAWFAQANPLTGKVPTISYGGPDVPPEEPSPHSIKLTESLVILEFLADLFPDSGLLPPASNPIARARARFFIDRVVRDLQVPLLEVRDGVPGAKEKLLEGLEKIQTLLPDPAAPDGGEYAIGKAFTIADCAIVPLLAYCLFGGKTDPGRVSEPGTATPKLRDMLEGPRFERLGKYVTALWERESVKRVADLERMESLWRARVARE